MYEKYLGLVVLALLIAIGHCWNPAFLQERHDGKPTGRPNMILIILVSLLITMALVYLVDSKMGMRMGMDMGY